MVENSGRGPTLGAGPRPARIEARDWGWRHHGRKAFAVRGLDLSIEPGERVLLLGASGSGKSTLLAGLAGLLDNDGDRRDTGSLTIDGLDPHEPQLRGRVGLVLQDPQAQTVLARCGDDVAFGCENLAVPPSEIWTRVDAALEAVGLPVLRSRPTEFLSGGQRQRLALAGVVAMSPGLLLLDEPTANLDPAGVVEVRQAVATVLAESGATLVVVEHHVETWLDLVTRVIVLEPGGGVRADGPPDQVLRERGAELADAGVWVPGYPPAVPGRRPARGWEGGNAQSPNGWRTGGSAGILHTVGLAVTPAGAPAGALPAASGIGLTVQPGRCLAIEGVNGAGKSTLALTLAGLLPPTAGNLTAAPDLVPERVRRGRRYRRAEHGNGPWTWRSVDLLTRIGMVFQDPEHQFVANTVREELRHGPLRAGRTASEADARASQLLEQLRLDRLAEANPFTLSGGEKRRLSVATALATRPRLLVLDEPTFGQDRLTWAEIVAIIAELLDDGLAAVVVTHDEAVVNALADDRLHLAAPVREFQR